MPAAHGLRAYFYLKMNTEVGNQLRKAREDRSLSLDQVNQAIHIRKQYLEALEAGNFGAMPSAIQVKGFLRSYAEYLGLDADILLESLSVSPPPVAEPEPPAEEAAPDIAAQGKIAAQEIFREIGAAIQSRREVLGLSTLDIEEHLRIPPRYIEMLETGQFDAFPSPVQARGMLGNYVDFLEMDRDSVFIRYADALQTRLKAAQSAEMQSLQDEGAKTPGEQISPVNINLPRANLPPWLRNIISGDVLVFGVLGVIAIIFVIWGAGRVITIAAGGNLEPTAPSIAQILLPSPSAAPSPSSAAPVTPAPNSDNGNGTLVDPQQPTPEVTLPFLGDANVQLFIVVRQRTYLRVTVDGSVKFDGRVAPGSNLPFSGQESIALLTGNGAALQVYFNEQDLGPLGIQGEVINVIYRQSGRIFPTATITPTVDPDLFTPTPTATSPAAATPTATQPEESAP